MIDTERIVDADLDDGLVSLITDDRYRIAARELAAEIAATPGPDRVVPILQTLASDRTPA